MWTRTCCDYGIHELQNCCGLNSYSLIFTASLQMWLSQIVSSSVSSKATSLHYCGGLELNVSVPRYIIVFVLKCFVFCNAFEDIIFIAEHHFHSAMKMMSSCALKATLLQHGFVFCNALDVFMSHNTKWDVGWALINKPVLYAWLLHILHVYAISMNVLQN